MRGKADRRGEANSEHTDGGLADVGSASRRGGGQQVTADSHPPHRGAPSPVSIVDLTVSPHLHRKGHRLHTIVPARQWRTMSTTERGRALAAGARPGMAGADGDDDGDAAGDDGDSDGTDDADDGDDAADDPAATRRRRRNTERPDDDTDDDTSSDDDEDDAETARLRAEVSRLKRETAEAKRARRKAERQAERRRREEQEDDGRYQEIATEATQRAERAEGKLRDYVLLNEATRIARTQGFNEPEEALEWLRVKRLLPDDVIDEDGEVDERSLERSLKKLGERQPKLLKDPEKVQRDRVGGGERRNGNGRASRRPQPDEEFNPRGNLAAGYR